MSVRVMDPDDRKHWTGIAVSGRRLIVLAQPQLATMAHAAPSEHGPAVQRMPRIVDSDLLSVVGRM